MSFTWAQIRDYYLGAAGRSTEAVVEAYDHLTVAYRRLCSLVDVEELYQPDARLTIAAGEDFVDLPDEVFSLYTVFNLTHGHKMEPEESGMRGRTRYLEAGTGKPPLGIATHYARAGGRLYVRDTARERQELKLQYKLAPTDITPADLASHPLTPPHLDWALPWFAAANYYAAHPERESYPGEQGGPTISAQVFEARATQLLAEPKAPKGRENADRREFVRQRGYSFDC